MEKNFYTDEFEDFLKEKADHYKMYPTERVWKKVYRQLHTYRRWTMYGLSAILMGAAFFGGKLIMNGADTWLTSGKNPDASTLPNNTTLAQPPHQKELIIAANNFDLHSEPPAINTLQQDINHHTLQQDINRPDKHNHLSVAWLNRTLLNHQKNSGVPQVSDRITAIEAPPTGNNSIASINAETIASNSTSGSTENNNQSLRKQKLNLFPPFNAGLSNIDYRFLNRSSNNIDPVKLFDALKKDPVQEAVAKANKAVTIVTPTDTPLQEEITEKNLPVLNRKKIHFQFYIGPTISYRRLTDRSNKINLNNRPLNSLVDPHLDVDSYVEHKPSIGFEAGAHALVKLDQTFTLKTGLQFNLSRYQIEGYNYYDEPSVIELNSNLGSQVDEVIVSRSSIRNFSGYSRRLIHNQYMQLSLPVGIEMRVAGNSKLNFNIAGTIQPTYILNHDSYLLSTDYKNYSREPSLARRWNINSGIEAYVTYERNGLQWQIGPQFRYQLLSSFDSRYPIKEYLVDYGVKIGVSKILK